MLRRTGYLAAALAPALICFLAFAWSAPAEEGLEPEVSEAAAGLLKTINTAPEKTLYETPGLKRDIVAKILAHRNAGKSFKNLVELLRVSRISPTDMELLLKPYQEIENQKMMEAARKPVPDAPASGKARGRLSQARGETPPPTAGGDMEGPIGAVRPGFFGKLPGFDDLDKIDPLKKTEFLETVNREMCTCGCQNETVAFCLVNDPGCPVVKARAKKIYDDIMTKPPR